MKMLALTLAASLLVGGTALAKDAPAKEQVVDMQVTGEGFVPASVKVKKDQPVVLKITRKTDKTCATEIEIDEHGISQKLPLNETVAVKFTPKATGQLKYGCAMGKMIGGVLTVE